MIKKLNDIFCGLSPMFWRLVQLLSYDDDTKIVLIVFTAVENRVYDII